MLLTSKQILESAKEAYSRQSTTIMMAVTEAGGLSCPEDILEEVLQALQQACPANPVDLFALVNWSYESASRADILRLFDRAIRESQSSKSQSSKSQSSK